MRFVEVVGIFTSVLRVAPAESFPRLHKILDDLMLNTACPVSWVASWDKKSLLLVMARHNFCRGMAGIKLAMAIILGFARDVDALSRIDFAVKALGSNRPRSKRYGTGYIDAVVSFGRVSFAPGHLLYTEQMGSSCRVEHCTSSRSRFLLLRAHLLPAFVLDP